MDIRLNTAPISTSPINSLWGIGDSLAEFATLSDYRPIYSSTFVDTRSILTRRGQRATPPPLHHYTEQQIEELLATKPNRWNSCPGTLSGREVYFGMREMFSDGEPALTLYFGDTASYHVLRKKAGGWAEAAQPQLLYAGGEMASLYINNREYWLTRLAAGSKRVWVGYKHCILADPHHPHEQEMLPSGTIIEGAIRNIPFARRERRSNLHIVYNSRPYDFENAAIPHNGWWYVRIDSRNAFRFRNSQHSDDYSHFKAGEYVDVEPIPEAPVLFPPDDPYYVRSLQGHLIELGPTFSKNDLSLISVVGGYFAFRRTEEGLQRIPPVQALPVFELTNFDDPEKVWNELPRPRKISRLMKRSIPVRASLGKAFGLRGKRREWSHSHLQHITFDGHPLFILMHDELDVDSVDLQGMRRTLAALPQAMLRLGRAILILPDHRADLIENADASCASGGMITFRQKFLLNEDIHLHELAHVFQQDTPKGFQDNMREALDFAMHMDEMRGHPDISDAFGEEALAVNFERVDKAAPLTRQVLLNLVTGKKRWTPSLRRKPLHKILKFKKISTRQKLSRWYRSYMRA